MRVIVDDEGSLGVLSLADALKAAKERELDLIEISPKAVPPVAKITDYGKFLYEQKKRKKEIKAKAHTVEVKNIQVKMGTGEHDLALKAKKASEWLKEGNRVKVELYLRGRAKYMDKGFKEERLERLLDAITEDYQVAEPARKAPKGLSMLIEPKKGGKSDKPKETVKKESKPTTKTASKPTK